MDVPVLDESPRPKRSSLALGRLQRDVLWNFASLGVVGVSGMAVNSFVLAYQGPAALGIFNQVFAVFIIASQVAVGGLQFSVLKHCSHAQGDRLESARITTSAVIMVAAAGGALALLTFLTRNIVGQALGSSGVAYGLGLAAPGLLLFAINKVLIMALNAHRHMRAVATFQALRVLLLLAGLVLLTVAAVPGQMLSVSLTAAEAVLLVGLGGYVHLRLFPPEFTGLTAWWGRHLDFGARGFLSGALIELNTRVDVLVLGAFKDDLWVGVYSFAAVFAEGFGQLPIVVRQNVDPIIGAALASRDLGSIEVLSRRLRRIFWPAMAALGACLVAFYPVLLWVLHVPNETWKSWPVLAILVSGIMLSAGFRPFFGILLQGGRPGSFSLMIAGSALANVLLNVALVPPMGLLGSAIATATVYVLEGVAIVLLARQLLGVRL